MAMLSGLHYGVILVLIFILASLPGHEAPHSRQKRYLDLPKGSAFTVTIAISTFLPKDTLPEKVLNGFGHIIEYDFSYPFPDRLTFMNRQKKPAKKKAQPAAYVYPHEYPSWPQDVYLQPESAKRRKWKRPLVRKGKVLDQLAQFITRLGFDGKGCLKRLACEASDNLSYGRSLLDDIVLLFLSQLTKEDCKTSFLRCSISPLQILMHSAPLDEAHVFQNL